MKSEEGALEDKPQEGKQEREVQGGVVFAKPRARPPAPPSNPLQPLLQNKLVLIIVGVLVLGLAVFVVLKMTGSSKKAQKKQEQPAKAEQKETKEADQAVNKTEKPAEGAAPEKQAAGGKEESAELKLSEEAGQAASGEVLEPVAYKPPPKKQQPKKIKDTPGLMKMLDEALIKGDESKLSYAVMGIEKNGDTVVDYLKEYIIANFDKPAARINAILALFYSSKGDAVAVIKTVLKVDPDEDVRLTALSVLDSLCGQEELEFIKDIAKHDPSEKVRKKALEYVEIRSIGQ